MLPQAATNRGEGHIPHQPQHGTQNSSPTDGLATQVAAMQHVFKPTVTLRPFSDKPDESISDFITGVRAARVINPHQSEEHLTRVVYEAIQGRARDKLNEWICSQEKDPNSVYLNGDGPAKLEALLGYLEEQFGQSKSRALVQNEKLKAFIEVPI